MWHYESLLFSLDHSILNYFAIHLHMIVAIYHQIHYKYEETFAKSPLWHPVSGCEGIFTV
jgi:hypothetical protein